MFRSIDALLNTITMYKLVLYYLIGLIVAAVTLCVANILPYNPFALVFSTLFIVAICWGTNAVAAWAFDAPTNVESLYITALILALIITPPAAPFDPAYISIALWASIWAMASKFIFAIGKKHLFNPAAFAVTLTAVTIGQSASWWVGTRWMAPFVLLGGALIVRKIRRSDMVIGFFVAALATITAFGLARGSDAVTSATRALLDTPILFFAFVMLTEPLTTPPTRMSRILYGGLTGFLFAPGIHVGSVYSTPELALLVGNVFSYLDSPKEKLLLRLKGVEQVADQTYDFVFHPDQRPAFTAGQYFEWTLPHMKPDSRGNRRYFTIASSPTEKEIRMGVKFYPKPSSFKKRMLEMREGSVIVASQLSGDFVLPRESKRKLVFIAGGIGITPFRSMVKFLSDIGQKRTITLFYSNKTPRDIAYADIFEEGAKKIGLRTVYTITDAPSVPPDWKGRTGFIDERVIAEEVPDYPERYFYLSGPHAMVVAFEKTLHKMGIRRSRIHVDYFPGFA